jgi:transposase
MLLDGAGWHRATDPLPDTVDRFAVLRPELNPVEHLWDHLGENDFGNQDLPALIAVTDLLCQGLRDLDQQPQQVKPLT